MAKTRQQKEESISELRDKLQNSKATVFANFQGLKVSESEELRKLCRDQNIEFIATKKTLLNKALTGTDIGVGDVSIFEGGVATIFGKDDEVAPAQIVAKFAKSHDVVKLFGGILEGKFIDKTKVEELSKLPSKQELYARVVGTLNAPISGFVNVLAGNIRGLVTALDAIAKQKS
jgi:large subunit ribosomal protein L10